ncbi:hypothetical protein J6590_007127 [Homalodisca vitripennis]|nr:hypothetical protein J6590_007127 [Homalodisca vitripennis]
MNVEASPSTTDVEAISINILWDPRAVYVHLGCDLWPPFDSPIPILTLSPLTPDFRLLRSTAPDHSDSTTFVSVGVMPDALSRRPCPVCRAAPQPPPVTGRSRSALTPPANRIVISVRLTFATRRLSLCGDGTCKPGAAMRPSGRTTAVYYGFRAGASLNFPENV